MDADEYSAWAQNHAAMFPNWASKLRAMPNAQAVSQKMFELLSGVDYASAIEASSEMHSGELTKPFHEEAHVTTIAKRAREIEFARRRRNQPSWRDGEPTFKCHICRDSGTVRILHPASVKAAKAGDYDSFIAWNKTQHDRLRHIIDETIASGRPMGEHMRLCKEVKVEKQPKAKKVPSDCLCWCGCAAGQSRRDNETELTERGQTKKFDRPKRMPTFDPDLHVRVSDEAWWHEALEEAKSFQTVVEQYQSDFDEFNNS